MRPKVLEENIDNFNAVTKDAVERMVQIRDSYGEVPDLEGELSKWSTEGKAINSIKLLYISRYMDNDLFRLLVHRRIIPEANDVELEIID